MVVAWHLNCHAGNRSLLIITLFDLVLLTVVVLIGWLVWRNAGLRDRAVGLARQHCKQMDVQLLDDTVSLVRIRLQRDRRGQVVLARWYEFEFSVTGEQRYRGWLQLLGGRLESVELQPHRLH